MTKNVGGIDRTIRIAGGLALTAAAATGTVGVWGYMWAWCRCSPA
jgi:hypothetical protein